VVAALVVALPLVQVLRYQNAELHAVLDARAGLDPVARAVAVQRGLLAHRDLAAQVLGGRPALEPERRLRQAEVDDRLAALSLALASGAWERALQEAHALYEDWSTLSRRVTTHALNASDSDQAHRLLIEQTLQVIDLVSVAAAPETSDPAAARATRMAQGLPQLAWRIAAVTDGTRDAAARAADSAALQAQLALFERAQEARARALAERGRSIELERGALLAALAALLGAAGVLVVRIGRERRHEPAGGADEPTFGTRAQPAVHGEAGHLLRRLRQARDETESATPRAEPQPTLPPAD
jgi:hypothetical protein